jgi:hypothetical protein
VDGCAAVLHRFFLDDAQDIQSGRLGTADVADTVTARASGVVAFFQTRSQTLT